MGAGAWAARSCRQLRTMWYLLCEAAVCQWVLCHMMLAVAVTALMASLCVSYSDCVIFAWDRQGCS